MAYQSISDGRKIWLSYWNDATTAKRILRMMEEGIVAYSMMTRYDLVDSNSLSANAFI